MPNDDSSVPQDVVFITIPRTLASFHHLPEHVPLLSEDGGTRNGGYNFADGVKAMKRLLEASPDVPGSYLYRLYVRKWPLWQQAAPLLEAGRVVEAIPILVEALDLDPDCPLTCFQLGYCFRATGEHEKSVSFYEKALTFSPDAGWIHSNLGRTYEAWGKEEEARTAFWKALDFLPGDSYVLERLEALGDLVRLGEGTEGDDRVRYVKRSDFARKVAEEVKRRTDPAELLSLGFNLLNDRLWDLAEDCFERVRELDEKSAKALLGLGIAHLSRNHPAEAERWLVEYLDLEPESVAGHLNLFKVYLALEKNEEAWDHLVSAVRLDPDHRGALEQMTRYLVEADRREEAVTRLREMGEASPRAVSPWVILARLYSESGDAEHERECLVEAHRRKPGDDGILLALTAVLGGMNRAQEVLDLLAPRRDGLPFELTVNLALALGQAGRRDEGRRVLEAFRSRPGTTEADRGRADEILGQWGRDN